MSGFVTARSRGFQRQPDFRPLRTKISIRLCEGRKRPRRKSRWPNPLTPNDEGI